MKSLSIYDELGKISPDHIDEVQQIQDNVGTLDDEIIDLRDDIIHLSNTWKDTDIGEAIEVIEEKLEDFIRKLNSISSKLY